MPLSVIISHYPVNRAQDNALGKQVITLHDSGMGIG